MRLPAYRNVIQSILSANCDKNRRDLLLVRLREVFQFPRHEHEKIIEELEENTICSVVIEVELDDGQQIISKTSDSREFIWRYGDERKEIELGHDRSHSLSFSIREEGEKKKLLSRLSKRKHGVKNEWISIDISHLIPDIPYDIQLIYEGGVKKISILLQMKQIDEEECHISLNDALHLVKQVIHSNRNTEEEKDTSHFLLHYPFVYYSLPPILHRLLTIAVYLKWNHPNIQDGALRDQLLQLSQYSSNIPLEENGRRLIKRCLRHVRNCVAERVRLELKQIPSNQYFPPTGAENLRNTNNSLKDVMTLCVLPQWEEFDEIDPSEILREILIDKLTLSVHQWCEQNLLWECSLSEGKEKETYFIFDRITNLLKQHKEICELFYDQFHINYICIVTTALDDKVNNFISNVLSYHLNEMRRRSKSDDVTKVSQITMRLFESLHKLEDLGVSQGKKSNWEMKEDLFEECPIYWSTTWSTLSREMLSRCSSLDDSSISDGSLPSSLYSFLCIQKAISDDLSRLSLTLSHNLIIVTIRVVNIYCDNLMSYSNHLLQFSSREGDLKSREIRTVRALNAMEQSMSFLIDNWKRFCSIDKLFHDKDGKAVVETSEKLIHTTIEKCIHSRDSLMGILVEIRTREGLERITQKILMDKNELKNTLTSYMRDISDDERLDEIGHDMDKISSISNHDIDSTLINSLHSLIIAHLSTRIQKHLKQGQNEAYYRFIYDAIQVCCDVLGVTQCDSPFFRQLYYYSQSSKDLILQFYSQLADYSSSYHDTSSISFIKIRTSASFVSDGLISLSLHVTSLSGLLLPSSPRCSCTLVLRVTLLPLFLFNPPYQSELPLKNLMNRDNEPKRRHSFRMLVSPDAFFSNGSVVNISLIEKDYLSFERVIGSNYILLSQLPVSNEFSDDLSQYRLCPLITPPPFSSMTIFQTLKSRSSSDRLAKLFIRSEMRKIIKSTLRSSHIFITQSLSTLSLP